MEVASAPRIRIARVRTAALRTAIGLAIGAILTLTFLHMVNVSAVFTRIEHLAVGFALLCSVAFLGAYVVRALRWRRLLRPYELSVPRAIAIYQIATFLNWLLPIRGGELVKCLLLRRSDDIPVSRSLATVSIDKAMDLLPAVALLALLPFVGLDLGRPLWILLLSALAAVAVAVVVLGLAAWRRDLALILPTPPGQVGSNELIGLLIFTGMFGVNSSGVGAMFLFSHPWTAILMMTSGLICLSVMGLTLRSALRLAGTAGERKVA